MRLGANARLERFRGVPSSSTAPGRTCGTSPGSAVAHGEVGVRRKGRELATPGSGDFAGESALLSKAPRNATVTAVPSLDVLVITELAFLDPLNRMPWPKLSRVLAERLGDDGLGSPS